MSKYIKLEDALNCVNGYFLTGLHKAIESLPTIEVSEDCISRAGALKAYNEAVDELVKAEMKEFNLGDFTECSFNTTQLKLIARKIENAPSVVPSRAEGEQSRCIWCDSPYRIEYNWIDNEGNTASFADEDRHLVATGIANYCPNCGAKMKGADDE